MGSQSDPVGTAVTPVVTISNAVHLCLDMQCMFDCNSDWATPWLRRVLPRVLRLATHRPADNVFTRFIPPWRAAEAHGTWQQLYSQWSQFTQAELPAGRIELLPELRDLSRQGLVVDKPGYSAFYKSNLCAVLEERHIDTLVVTGTETDVCVAATLFDAIDRGYRTLLVADCVCSSADETHDKQMRLYQSRLKLQLEVVTLDQVLLSWPR